MKEACLRLSSRQKARSQTDNYPYFKSLPPSLLRSKSGFSPCSARIPARGSDPGLSAAFDLRYVTVASQSAGRLRRDGRLYRSHQRDVFSCSSKFLADYNYNGVLTRYKARRRLSHASRHSDLAPGSRTGR